MSDDNLLPFPFAALQRKKITAAFDGGRITSGSGVMLLAQAEPSALCSLSATHPAGGYGRRGGCGKNQPDRSKKLRVFNGLSRTLGCPPLPHRNIALLVFGSEVI
jgi:hypothetical protein